jgi:hypothetical protein
MESPETAKSNASIQEKNTVPWEWHIQETFKGLTTLFVEALKILSLVNGGAVVAILTFCGNLAAKGQPPLLQHLKPAILFYCTGLTAAMAAFIIAYCNQLRLYNEERSRHEGKTFIPFHIILVVAGILLTFCALLAFVFGSLSAADAISPST